MRDAARDWRVRGERGEAPLSGGTRLTIASFVTPGTIEDDAPLVVLGDEAAHHARVRRLDAGAWVTLRDGVGAVADGRVRRVTKAALEVEVTTVRREPPPRPIHLLAPVSDRDRMLWLAEKVTELGVASWRPVLWRRSRSVSPRGEGEAFADKVRARMAQALAQCEGAWLPEVRAAITPERIAEVVDSRDVRLVLDAHGEPFDITAPGDGQAVTLALGPEGGLEPDELASIDAADFRRARLPGNILRFETAGVVGVAFARALLERAPAPHQSSEF